MTRLAKVVTPTDAITEATRHLRDATAAAKCWRCGCFHGTLNAVEQAFPAGERRPDLAAVVQEGKSRTVPVQYDCLGCAVCWPALALNALEAVAGDRLPAGDACPVEPVAPRDGWPPLPGAYVTLRYRAPVAVCTLTDAGLMDRLARAVAPDVAIVGTLQTENLGIERLLTNMLADPHIRFLLVCGEDSRKRIGHLPGQSLVALSRGGVDGTGRILGAEGRRPVIRNLPADAVAHFRRTVEVADLVGESDAERVLQAVRALADRNPGPAESWAAVRPVTPMRGAVPERMTPDPAGYMVVDVDRPRRLLVAEHYRNDGVLDSVIEGDSPGEVYTAVVEKGLVTRLDHAAYLGRELARAEHALLTGSAWVQDGAPERTPLSHPDAGCGCDGDCGKAP